MRQVLGSIPRYIGNSPFPRVFWFKFPARPRHRATHELMTRRRYRFFFLLSSLSCFHPLHFIHYPLPFTGSHFHSSIPGIQLFSHFLRRSPTLHPPFPPRVSHTRCLFLALYHFFSLFPPLYTHDSINIQLFLTYSAHRFSPMHSLSKHFILTQRSLHTHILSFSPFHS